MYIRGPSVYKISVWCWVHIDNYSWSNYIPVTRAPYWFYVRYHCIMLATLWMIYLRPAWNLLHHNSDMNSKLYPPSTDQHTLCTYFMYTVCLREHCATVWYFGIKYTWYGQCLWVWSFARKSNGQSFMLCSYLWKRLVVSNKLHVWCTCVWSNDFLFAWVHVRDWLICSFTVVIIELQDLYLNLTRASISFVV